MDTMAIATLSTQMAQQNLMQEISIGVMRNAMDHAEQTAEMMADMLQTASVPPVGFDGLGAMLDIMV
ncbi:MAG: YjfB family protein [Defluviitaleaceae bacterium]|nr:YjfB family protein [Defluviitaleaceae bacterium]